MDYEEYLRILMPIFNQAIKNKDWNKIKYIRGCINMHLYPKKEE